MSRSVNLKRARLLSAQIEHELATTPMEYHMGVVMEDDVFPDPNRHDMYAFREEHLEDKWSFFTRVTSMDRLPPLIHEYEVKRCLVYDMTDKIVLEYKPETKSFEKIQPSEEFQKKMKETDEMEKKTPARVMERFMESEGCKLPISTEHQQTRRMNGASRWHWNEKLVPEQK